ncbi:hypothetical protein [Methanobrevibacter sp.]|uniref:hypothetical protein n=1 Tax=Methanobrevibacter sp. TaxID=66852 RepID=UPI00388F94BA
MFVGERIKHKIFGEGEVVNVICKQSGIASVENYVIVMFDTPTLTEFDKIRYPESHGISERTFTPASLKAFLVKEDK